MLIDFSTKYPDAQNSLTSWWTVCKKNDFSSFNDIKLIFDTIQVILLTAEIAENAEKTLVGWLRQGSG
jgi:mRNA-degrading endonuclease HigB of HigAB toxin-antitoxin module